MAKIKDAKIIYPRIWGDLKINYLPSRNDRHTLRLKIDLVNECFYHIRGMFFDTNDSVYIIIDIDYPANNNSSNNTCFDRAIIKAVFDSPEAIKVSMNFEGLSFNERDEFETLIIPELPRFGDNVLVRLNDNIYCFNCKAAIIKDNNENPEILVSSVNVYSNEKEIFTSWIGANSNWPI